MSQSGTLVLIMAIAVLAPLPAYGIGRWLPVPLVIFEILPGILVGPDVLGWAGDGQVTDTLSHLGPTSTSVRPSPAPPSARPCRCCATPGTCTRGSGP